MPDYQKITELPSNYDNIEQMSTKDILTSINNEDIKVAHAVRKGLPKIEKLVDRLTPIIQNEGRVFYLGAGTSGRIGILDASEIPPTFGVSNRIIGVIAGGEQAITNAVENAEDSSEKGWEDLQLHKISRKDALIGIAASGTTPYVISALEKAQQAGIITACITNNPKSPITKVCDFPIEVNVGPEFITGSTRMKSGTSQKLIVNMISTSLMIKLGRIKGNKMINMQLTNQKLLDRGVRYIVEILGMEEEKALTQLIEYGSVNRVLIENKKIIPKTLKK